MESRQWRIPDHGYALTKKNLQKHGWPKWWPCIENACHRPATWAYPFINWLYKGKIPPQYDGGYDWLYCDKHHDNDPYGRECGGSEGLIAIHIHEIAPPKLTVCVEIIGKGLKHGSKA